MYNFLKKVFKKLAFCELLNWMPSKPYISLYYYFSFHKKLDLKNPKTYNEKLQWIKLYDHKPIYSRMVDKYTAKEYASSLIGEEYIIPTLYVWDRAEDIDFSQLPDNVVLKTTHDSGGVKILDRKLGYNEEEIRAFFKKRLKRSLYNITREWPYKDVKPRIIAEPFLEDDETKELRDYKIYTFNGEPAYYFIAQGRQSKNTHMDYFDLDNNRIEMTWGYPNSENPPAKPDCIEKMIELSRKLAAGTIELRVDFYYVNGKIYFGELTFFDGSGFSPIVPDEWDYRLGEKITLPAEKK